MTAREARAESNHGKWCKISSTITEAIREQCNEGGTNICVKRTELTSTDISYLIDLGYKFISNDEEGIYCYISWDNITREQIMEPLNRKIKEIRKKSEQYHNYNNERWRDYYSGVVKGLLDAKSVIGMLDK